MRINPDAHRRAMDEEGIYDLLEKTDVGRMATVGENGIPYIVPVHYVFEGQSIYFHCGLKGKKLDHINTNPWVCFEVDEVCSIKLDLNNPCKSTTVYCSVIITGKARVVLDVEKKRSVLGLLMDKHSKARGTWDMTDKSIDATCVVEIVIDDISGKKLPG